MEFLRLVSEGRPEHNIPSFPPGEESIGRNGQRIEREGGTSEDNKGAVFRLLSTDP